MVSPGLALDLNVVVKQSLDGFLDVVLPLQRFFVGTGAHVVSLGDVLHVDDFLHFARDVLEPDHAVVEDAHLEVVAQGAEQPIELLQDVRHLADSEPGPR